MRRLTNPAQSVKARLLQLSVATGEDYQRLLTRYGIERLLYRLSQSAHAGQFILKGAMLFRLWDEMPFRPTRDLDLLGFNPDESERLRAVFADLCALEVEPDGIVFDATTINVEAIREEARYHGQRVKLVGLLERTRLRLQIDVGFGDAVVPAPELVEFPPLLDYPAPQLRAYRRETVVAEKLEALVQHGLANSRVKDLVDLWHLARHTAFEGGVLCDAIAATFERRETAIPAEPPALTAEFTDSPLQQQLWQGFLARTDLTEATPPFAEVMAFLAEFLLPPLRTLAEGRPFDGTWEPGGPWR